jgi:hypothetical protein
MSGYVVSARIAGGSLRFAGRGPAAPNRADPVEEADRGSPETHGAPSDAIVEAFDLGGAADFALIVRWTAFRERWSQLTFYLTSTESWR